MENENYIYNTRFFYLHAILNLHCESVQRHNLYPCGYDLYSLGNLLAGGMCIPAGMISNQQPRADTYL